MINKVAFHLKQVVKSYELCQVHRPKQKNREPLRTTVMPDRPLQKVAADSCELQGRHFVVVDYFSKFIKIAYLDFLASATVIRKMKSIQTMEDP